jgi:hypothetical protein
LNPKFAHTLSGTIADERRHVGFGENRIGSLIRENPHRKGDVERMQKEMSYYMLATFADSFRAGPAQEEMARLRRETGAAPGKSEWQGVDLSELEPREMEAVLSTPCWPKVQEAAGPVPERRCGAQRRRQAERTTGGRRRESSASRRRASSGMTEGLRPPAQAARGSSSRLQLRVLVRGRGGYLGLKPRTQAGARTALAPAEAKLIVL